MKKLRITLEGKTYEVGVEVADGSVAAAPVAAPVAAAPVAAPVAAPAPAPVAAPPVAAAPVAAGAGAIVCPMPGTIWKIRVAVGDQVAAEQELIVLEAMKMESPVYSHAAGTITAILVKEGDSVSEGQVLIQMS